MSGSSWNLFQNLPGHAGPALTSISSYRKLVFREGERLVEVSERPAIVTRIRAMIVLREAARHALCVQVEDAPEASITNARSDLNTIYDAFVAKHGYVTSRENRVFALDPDFPLILSLENFDAATKKTQKTEIFFKRTIERSEVPFFCMRVTS